jgi:hypothetical protein
LEQNHAYVDQVVLESREVDKIAIK